MIGFKPNYYWIIMWLFVTPATILVSDLFLCTLSTLTLLRIRIPHAYIIIIYDILSNISDYARTMFLCQSFTTELLPNAAKHNLVNK